MNSPGVSPTVLGTEPIGKLLKTYAIPAIIAMTASSLYNMIDSIFIGHGVGAYAISGIAVTFPLMNLAAAFGTLVGVGASTLISVLLGQRNYEAATKVLSNTVTLCLIAGIAFSAVALIFLDPILLFFGASENTIGYARDYMRVILLGNVITHLYLGLNNLQRAIGEPKKAMGATLFTVVLNVALAPIFIFTFKMGTGGAALATVIAQLVAAVWVFFEFTKKTKAVHFGKKIIMLDRRIARDSLSIGFAPFLMNVAACLIVIFLNKQMMKYGGDLAIGAYGIVNRISFLFLMIVFGLNQGMQPIAGYNYGARQYARVKEVFWKTVRYAIVVMSVGFILGLAFPKAVASVFTSDAELIRLSAMGLTITVLMFPLVAFQVVTSNFFQSMGMVNKAIWLSLSRQILFLLPCIFLLPHLFADNPIQGVWASFPVSDFFATILAAILLKGLMNKFDKLKDGDDPSILGGI
ncbi:MATE family efflux transporter [Muribaculum sp. An289]|uniref:MATE family efflux transporter n=1 Tax=unclassified Muribaculum TaxID=2622126 RepID=UPI000B36DE0A|nr:MULTISPECIES: MATE family efflux transporter [unclassified Muribaculum]OUO37961.1 MATE family efflux transporter [Muribaculum sp. An289]OUO44336.1 MATE family efflux transporter [Muribaculum sp. An287]